MKRKKRRRNNGNYKMKKKLGKNFQALILTEGKEKE